MHAKKGTTSIAPWLLCLTLAVGSAPLARGAVYVVTNTSDNVSTAGSLRWAINQANTNPGFDRVNFNIPGSGIHTITLTNDRLVVLETVDINALTQPGYSGSPLIYINVNGYNEAFLVSGARMVGIQGFTINNFSQNGFTIWSDATECWIQYNWIGFNPDGVTDNALKELRGIGISSSYNVIRGNVISGVFNGITIGTDIYSPTWDYVYTNWITDNYIGLDPTGTFAIPNTSDGIFLGAGAAGTWIGPGNVVSGNLSAGIELLHWSNQWNIIFSNTIGLNAAGNAAIPNWELGILISNGANQNAVGGSWGANTISGNNGAAIAIGDTGPDLDNPQFVGGWGNWIYYNKIGTDVTGTFAIPNLLGIHIVGANAYWNTMVENEIVGNHWWGIYLYGALTNWIDNNYIGENGYDGILLQKSSWNTVNYNTIVNNGFDTSFSWLPIREVNGSHSNNFWMNTTN